MCMNDITKKKNRNTHSQIKKNNNIKEVQKAGNLIQKM